MTTYSEPQSASIVLVERAGGPALRVPIGTIGRDLITAFRTARQAGYSIPRDPVTGDLAAWDDDDTHHYIGLQER